jgi:NDP-sugar pyrophosphorylase family protein
MPLIKQAFVLGAGLGKRLRPLTDDLPKPLIPIFGKPLITFAIDHLCSIGVESFVINTHHLPGHFDEIFRASYRGRPVKLVHEPELLETGGGIKNVEQSLGTEPFIIYSGDILTDIDLAPLIQEHFSSRNDVTLALRETGLARAVALRDRRVVDIGNRYGHAGDYDFANVSIWNREIFERIPASRKISFVPVVADWIADGGKIGGVVLNERTWFNIGSRQQYLDVHRTIAEQRWKPAYITSADWPIAVARDAKIDSSARLVGFHAIGAGCKIGAEAIVENSILWTGAQIASRTRLRNCIVRSQKTAEGDLRDIDI